MSRSKPLTDKELRALEGPCERAVGGVAGLYVKVRESGLKTLALRYRFAGEQRFFSLGTFPAEISLAEARDKAGGLRKLIRAGHDPSIEQAEGREALRMVDLLGADGAAGWYLETYVATAGRLGMAKSTKGIANDRSYIKTHLRSRKALMRKRVDAVTVGDLNAIKAAATPSAWRKVRNILLVCFRHAEEMGAIPAGSNPAARTKAATDAKRERFLTPDERKRLATALEELEELGPRGQRVGDDGKIYGGLSPHLVRALRLLELTGMRRSEVLKLQWQAIDWRASVLRIVGKTGPRVVPLTPQALAYLKREKGKGARMGLVVCSGDGNPIHPENVSRAWFSVRKLAKLEGVRLHDLRHSWASDAVSAGVPLYVVGKALGHTQPNTTARYSHLHDEAVRDGLAKAGAAIEAAKGGKA